MMEKSLLYKLHSHLMRPGVTADQELFKEVYRSKYGKVRIYQVLKVSKESKAWVADPSNRKCDAPGSWYCVGQYPPALDKLIARRKNFAQLEDFNSGGGNSEYTREYMARMNGEKPPSSGPPKQQKSEASNDVDDEEVRNVYWTWLLIREQTYLSVDNAFNHLLSLSSVSYTDVPSLSIIFVA